MLFKILVLINIFCCCWRLLVVFQTDAIGRGWQHDKNEVYSFPKRAPLAFEFFERNGNAEAIKNECVDCAELKHLVFNW